MDKFDRIQRLHRLFRRHRFPIPINQIASELECTAKTAKVAIDLLRDQLQAPLLYHPDVKGWQYDDSSEDQFELPGLWLTASELHGLAAILNIMSTMDEGLLGKDIQLIQRSAEKLLRARRVDIDRFYSVIKYISVNKRAVASQHFATITDALIHQQQLHIHYTDYANKKTQRTISPQTLIHYQENWYLDAWCHKRHALRSFMLPRLDKVIKTREASEAIDSSILEEYFASSYGIFAGQAKHTASLRFYPPVITEVMHIQWHPEQNIEFHEDYCEISIPYNDDRELIRNILQYGTYVEVIEPTILRNKIKKTAQAIIDRYKT